MSQYPKVPGLYEQPITQSLSEELEAVESELKVIEHIHSDTAPYILGQLLYERFVHALSSLPAKEKLCAQVEATNQVLRLLEQLSPAGGAFSRDLIVSSGQQLKAILEGSEGPAMPQAPKRPSIPLDTSDLLVNGPHDLSVGPEIKREIASADRVDLLCSFLKWSGVRLVEKDLEDLVKRRGHGALRILTTVYMRATEKKAIDALLKLGAEVKVSYDVNNTRLHAKAWLFHRDSGFSTGYVGSSNLSHSAMLDGLEWNVRLSQTDNKAILRKVRSTFEQYWDDQTTFRPYVEEEFTEATKENKTIGQVILPNLDLQPRPYQQEILDDLESEREHGHTRNLVVAATGTGKTIVAALDYRRLHKQRGYNRLLFVAHRKEILTQSRVLFQIAMKDSSFGELLVGGEEPHRWEYVFASIQSLHEDRLRQIPPDHFDVVIVDEFHHAGAPTYERLLNYINPKILLGLTATPERTDGLDIFRWFEGRIASELRLWKALDQGLLSPFQYFGIGGAPDLSQLSWKRGRYDKSALGELYRADHMFVRRILNEVVHKVSSLERMRALGFCVDIAHAELMAQQFTNNGIPSAAVHSEVKDRKSLLLAFRQGQIKCLFSVDLFNEGIDLPDVNTILFLRPTESATVFLQQLGRGLRKSPGKECLTVLDFIGNAHKKFRFDHRFRAILGGTRKRIYREIERGFPNLPAGCAIQLDELSQASVLSNIRQSLRSGFKGLAKDLRALSKEYPDLSLSDFLGEADIGLEELYSQRGHCWTALKREAGLLPPEEPFQKQMESALSRLLHIDDWPRLRILQQLLGCASAPYADERDPYQRMLFVLLGYLNTSLSEMQSAWDTLWSSPSLREELLGLLAILADQTRRLTSPLLGKLASLPLQVHATYSLDEITAAADIRTKKGAVLRTQAGVLFSESWNTDFLFVTLEKNEKDYSPTTRYNDYPISSYRFHWESQSSCHPATKTGKRYQQAVGGGSSHVLLFVRPCRKDSRGMTMPYTFLGPCYYESHQSERPMQIVWRLEHAMPPELYQETKVAAG